MEFDDEIKQFRNDINHLDSSIIEILAERVVVAKRIGEIKKRHGKSVRDRSRESEVYIQIRDLAKGKGLDPNEVEDIFKKIIQLCTKVQKSKV